jgi:Arm DNA-binding domain
VKAYRQCNCRAPATTGPDGKRKPGKLLGAKCPRLKDSKHGGWWGRYEAPPDEDGKRRQPRIGPYETKREADAALAKAIDQAGSMLMTATPASATTWIAGWAGMSPR